MGLRKRGRLLLCLALVPLVVVACHNAYTGQTAATESHGPVTTYQGKDFTKHVSVNAPGVTSSEIHVGSITSKTNPLGTNVAEFNDGMQGYFDLVNSKGGVWGRKIKLTTQLDDQTASNATTAQQLLSKNDVYAAFIATELFTGAPKLAAAGIPTFGWNINAEWAGHRNFFPNVGPICFTTCPQRTHLVPWVAQQVKAHKVAVVAYSVPQAADCAKGIVKSFQLFGKNVDAKVVYDDESLAFGQTDYSAQVSKMKSSGADFLATCMDYNGDGALAKELQKQGLSKKVTFFHANLYDPVFVKKNAKPLEGGILAVDLTAFEHQPPNPSVQQYLTAAKKDGFHRNEITAQGWVAALQFVNALKATGPNFTWANLVNAWNQQTWYTGDGWVAPINWRTEHEPGHSPWSDCANFVKVRNGKFVPIWDGGGSKPWVCFNALKPYQWQTPANVSFTGKPFNVSSVVH